MQIATMDSSQTMSSREIAEFTQKEHGHVKRDIENMLDQLEKDVSTFGCTYRDSVGRLQTEYVLNKDLTLTLVSGYSAPMRFAIIKRWQELEEKQAIKVPTTLSGALRLAAEQAEQIEAKDALLLEQAPKVAIYEILADRKQDVSTTLIAKQLGTTAIKLNQFLRESGVKWLNADLPKAGYSEWFNVVSDVKNGHEFHQCLITPIGQLEITKLWTAK